MKLKNFKQTDSNLLPLLYHLHYNAQTNQLLQPIYLYAILMPLLKEKEQL